MSNTLNIQTLSNYREFLSRPFVQRTAELQGTSHLLALYELSVNLATTEYLLSRMRLNDVYNIDAMLFGINAQLALGQYFIGSADYKAGYDTKVFVRGSFLPQIGMRQAAFMFHRVLPKLKLGERIYRNIMRGRKKRMCKTEILGRLSSAGFRIQEVKTEGSMLFFRVQKNSEPLEGYSPSYGPFIKLKRVVKGGALANVYKLRTMHPYAEFIQEYVYDQNSLDVGGKIKDDFRVSEEGILFRKYFMDELPMLVNLLKGDIKLIGVRPLSQHYLSLYDPLVREARLKIKPGLLPPFYSEGKIPADLNEVMASEMKYLLQYELSPWKTDMRYLYLILNNVIRNKLRSK